MDDDSPLSDDELYDDIDRAHLATPQILYALCQEIIDLKAAIDELKELTKKDRVITMTGRDGKPLTATSKVKD